MKNNNLGDKEIKMELRRVERKLLSTENKLYKVRNNYREKRVDIKRITYIKQDKTI